jgi:hypothetical protein
MNRLSTVTIACFMFGGVLCLSSPFSRPPETVSVFPEVLHLTVKSNADTVATFRVRNHLKSSIRIISVSTDCGCSTAKFSNAPIATGGHTDLLITIKPITKGRSVQRHASVLFSTDDQRYFERHIVALLEHK